VKSIAYSKQAVKALRRMPPRTARRIREKIELYAGNPEALAANVSALQGRPALRLRVGDWRILFAETEDAVNVLRIAPRGAAYD
jgi:mRNA interferase RelE/StbE